MNTQDDLLEGRTPLVFQGSELVPSASYRFAEGTEPMVYMEVYDPVLKRSAPPRVAILLKVIDRQSNHPIYTWGALMLNQFALPGSPLAPVGFKLPIQLLRPGDYRLEIYGADDTGDLAGPREVDFSIQ